MAQERKHEHQQQPLLTQPPSTYTLYGNYHAEEAAAAVELEVSSNANLCTTRSRSKSVPEEAVKWMK